MSSNRLKYDFCQYNTVLKGNKDMAEYVLYPFKYENCKKCHMQLGIVGGTSVSDIKGNLTDLESDLRGQTRPQTQSGQCPNKLYQPYSANQIVVQDASACNKRILNLEKTHLPNCQMFPLKAIPNPPTPGFYTCPNKN